MYGAVLRHSASFGAGYSFGAEEACGGASGGSYESLGAAGGQGGQGPAAGQLVLELEVQVDPPVLVPDGIATVYEFHLHTRSSLPTCARARVRLRCTGGSVPRSSLRASRLDAGRGPRRCGGAALRRHGCAAAADAAARAARPSAASRAPRAACGGG